MLEEKKQKTAASGIKKVFVATFKQQAQSSPGRWNSADSAVVGLKLFGQLTNSEGNPVTLQPEHEADIKSAFDAKGLQMKALEGVATACGAQIPEETRRCLERILDPGEFQQELIEAGNKKPSRKKKESLKALIEEVE